jgi:hypothetical protein
VERWRVKVAPTSLHFQPHTKPVRGFDALTRDFITVLLAAGFGRRADLAIAAA